MSSNNKVSQLRSSMQYDTDKFFFQERPPPPPGLGDGQEGTGNGGRGGFPPRPCISYAIVHNYYGPYAYCSLDKGVACAQHIQLPTHTCACMI